jgi:hypothetical protein
VLNSGSGIIMNVIVRDEHDLSAIQDYIRSNPMNWELDHENPALQNAKKDNHLSGNIPDFGRIRSD